MIHDLVIKGNVPHTARASRNGYVVKAEAGSPLAALTGEIESETAIIRTLQTSEVEQIDFVAETVSHASDHVNEFTGESRYAAAMNEQIEKITPKLREEIAFSRNVVAQEVQTIVGAVEAELASIKSGYRVATEFVFVKAVRQLVGEDVVDDAGVYVDETNKNLLVGFDKASPFDRNVLTVDVARELVLKSEGRVNPAVENFIKTVDAALIEEVLANISNNSESYNVPFVGDNKGPEKDALAYLILRVLHRGEPISAEGISLTDYKKRLAAMLLSASSALLVLDHRDKAFLASKVLVLNASSQAIKLFAPVYEKYTTEMNGNVDVLSVLGSSASVKDTINITIDDVIAKTPGLMAEYQQILTLRAAAIQRDESNIISRVAQAAYSNMLKSELVEHPENSTKIAGWVSQFGAVIGGVRVLSRANLEETIIRAVSAARYSNSIAGEILLAYLSANQIMKQTGSEDEEVNARSVASLAVMDVVCDWVVAQMRVAK